MTDMTYDRNARCAYLYLDKGRKVASTIEAAPGVNVDLDADGFACGVEFLHVSCPVVRVLQDGPSHRKGRKPK